MNVLPVSPDLTGRPRIQSLDLLRGLVMIIMALDHVRDFYYTGGFALSPTDLSKTHLTLFATRWVTHFCAPVFMFLAGTSAFLMGRKKTKAELSLFLLTRGLWLIFLELTIVAFGWSFQIQFHFIAFLVISALGFCMVALSALVWLPPRVILVFGLLLVCGHNALDNVHIAGNSLPSFLWGLLHEERSFTFGSLTVYVLYPILPWIGVMALGYCFGQLYAPQFNPARRRKILLVLGLSVTAFFVFLRLTNIYGDPSDWSVQSSRVFTFLSFLNTTKYPPSLLFLAMTLGPAMLFLALTENISNRFTTAIRIYGRVPMFYYLCHLYLIHLGAVALYFMQGFRISDFKNGPPQGYGVNLWFTYAIWLAIILLLYPLCRWYDRYKSRHKQNKLLSYL